MDTSKCAECQKLWHPSRDGEHWIAPVDCCRRVDTAKCAGVGCPIRDGCDRFVRPAVDGQRWILGLHGFTTTWIGGGLLVEPDRMSCRDHQPIHVEPHGGAREEGDGS